MSEWKSVRLGDVVEITSSKRVKRADYVENGVPFFRSKEVIQRSKGNDISTELFITEEHFQLISSKFGAPVEGDILLTSVGTLGVPYQVRSEDRFYFKDGNLTWFRNFEESVNPKFLYYWLTSPIAKRRFDEVTIGSTQKALTIVALKSIEIELPPIEVQNNIVEVVDSIDGKLSNNRQTSQTLESISQAIFKSWFIDFEPTRAKIAAKENGQDPELAAMAAIAGKELGELEALSADQLEKLKSTAALFPDNFEDSEQGEIPEGWSIGSVGDIALAKGGYAFKGKSFVDEGHPVVKIKNITGDGRVDLTGAVCINDEQASSSKRFKLNDGDLLMAMTGATVGKIGFVTTGGKAVYLNQRVAKFESEKFGRKISWFLFCCFGRSSIFDSVVGAAQGSAQPNISSSGIEATQLVIPSHELIEEFSNKSDSLFKKWLCNIDENAGLEQLRDTILPKLLSGELNLSSEAVA